MMMATHKNRPECSADQMSSSVETANALKLQSDVIETTTVPTTRMKTLVVSLLDYHCMGAGALK